MFILFTLQDTDKFTFDDNEYVIALYEKYSKPLWKYAYTLSKNNEIANDLIATTFLKIIENMAIIRKIRRYKIKSYLLSMVKNTYYNYIKKEKKEIDFDTISEYSYNNTDDDFTDKIGISEVEETLNHMPEPYRSILIYRYVYDELTYEEIAISLNINVNSIRVYKQRALEMLKQRMKGGKNKNEEYK